MCMQLPAAVVECARDVLEMALKAQVYPVAALLLDVCPAACSAAMDAFLQVEDRIRGKVCAHLQMVMNGAPRYQLNKVWISFC